MQEIERNKNLGLALVGFIDDDIGKQNRRFLGYPVVGGKDCLKEVINKHHILEVIISFRKIDKKALNLLKKQYSLMGVNLSCLNIGIE